MKIQTLFKCSMHFIKHQGYIRIHVGAIIVGIHIHPRPEDTRLLNNAVDDGDDLNNIGR